MQPLEGIAFASSAVNLPGPLATSRLAEFADEGGAPGRYPPAHAAKERRLVQMEAAMRAAVRLCAWVCAEIAFPARPRKYSGAKLHRRKLIR